MRNLLQKNLALMLTNISNKERKYYCEVEYIESTGTQFINTGITPNANSTSVKLAFALTELANVNTGLFGAMESGRPERGTLYTLFTGTTWGADRIRNDWSYGATTAPEHAGQPDIVLTDVISVNSIIEAELNADSSATINGGAFSQSSVTKINCAYPLFMGAVDVLGVTQNIAKAKAKWYYCKIWEGGVLIRDMIPVLDWNYTPCMYDKVRDTLFYNKGTGSFIAGNIVEREPD